MYGEPAELMVDVEAPSGEVLAIDDPRLIGLLVEGIRNATAFKLVRSERALTDCRPLSMFSVQTVQQLSQELGSAIDQRRFRANVYLDLASGDGFGEQEFVGRSLRIGSKAVISSLGARSALQDDHAGSRYRPSQSSDPQASRAGP